MLQVTMYCVIIVDIYNVFFKKIKLSWTAYLTYPPTILPRDCTPTLLLSPNMYIILFIGLRHSYLFLHKNIFCIYNENYFLGLSGRIGVASSSKTTGGGYLVNGPSQLSCLLKNVDAIWSKQLLERCRTWGFCINWNSS